MYHVNHATTAVQRTYRDVAAQIVFDEFVLSARKYHHRHLQIPGPRASCLRLRSHGIWADILPIPPDASHQKGPKRSFAWLAHLRNGVDPGRRSIVSQADVLITPRKSYDHFIATCAFVCFDRRSGPPRSHERGSLAPESDGSLGSRLMTCSWDSSSVPGRVSGPDRDRETTDRPLWRDGPT
jgi:hypothetical protein